jgi:hypothetical protein
LQEYNESTKIREGKKKFERIGSKLKKQQLCIEAVIASLKNLLQNPH